MENVNTLSNLIFDSSLTNIDAVVSSEEYKERLIALLKPILEHRFPNIPGKQQIHAHHDRISFACPVCGDSMKSNYKKRGNFILTGKYAGFFKCHNCGHSSRIDTFFRDYHVDLDLSIINYIAKGIQDFSGYKDTRYDMSLFVDMNVIDKYAIDRQEFLKKFGLIEIQNSPAWTWLKNRLQYDAQKFMYNEKENYIVILNLTPAGRVLGAQKRLFKGENKYLTYKLSKIYELLKKDVASIPDEIDTISTIFNICLVNYAKPLTLFEGPLDSFLFRNSIANTGANKELPIDVEIRYFYDDDNTGRKRSIEKITQGNEIFLWTKFKNKYELPERHKWDLNDALIHLKNKNIKVPNFDEFFSNNPLDIIDI